MAEIDPVILELRADLGKYQAGIRTATRTVETQLGKQERSSQRLEKQMLRSSTSISSAFRGLAGTLAAAFTGRELVGLVDSFTRLQNSLKVAGLEGESLANVQERLRSIGSQYGVELEALGSVFNRAALAQKELGASTEDIIQLNEVVAASLKVTGSSSEQARGALLQLSQAIGQDVVRGEEFNSILEGALPLAQAAARGIEGMGGSVAKLRGEVIAGNITSKEFFEGILKGGTETIKQAEAATLTLGGAFTVLRNELTLYVGNAAKTSGVTVALSDAIKGLADNLDRIIPALAIIATILGTRYVAGAVAASGATRALIAYLSLATTSLAGTALAARGAGAALLGALGGPVGVAVLALVGGIIYLKSETEKAGQASAEYRDQQERLAKIQDKTTEATNSLATATGKARQEAIANAKAIRQETIQYLANARAATIAAQAKAAAARNEANVTQQQTAQELSQGDFGLRGGNIASSRPGGNDPAVKAAENRARKAEANVRIAEKNERDATANLVRIDAIIKAPPAVASVAPGKDKKTKKGPKAPKDRTDEILSRFNDELASLAQQTLSAQQSLATSAQDRAELELRSIELARINTVESINAEKDYTAAQKQRLIQQVEALTDFEREAVERQKQAQLSREASDIAQTMARIEQDSLRDQLDLARTQAERRDIALRIVDAFYDSERAALEGALLAEDINDADRAILQAKLGALDAAKRAETTRAKQDTAGPLESYVNSLPQGFDEIGQSIEGAAVSGIKDLNSGLAEAIVNGENLGNVLENAGKQFVAQLIQIGLQLLFIEAIKGIGSALGFSLPGFANGTNSAPGGLAIVGERGPEIVNLPKGSQVIPNNQINARTGQSGGQTDGRITITLSEDLNARVESIAGPIAVEVVKIAAPQITNAAVSETFRRSSRPRI
jgi:tape measure domain-containing protein